MSSYNKNNSVYSDSSTIYQFDTNFIHQNDDNIIDKHYWRKQISQSLQESKKQTKNNPLKDLYIDDDDHADINGSHRYYIERNQNFVVDVTVITHEFEKKLPGCKVMFDKMFRPGKNRAESFQLYILITKDMQKRLNRKIRRKEWMKERCNFRDICLLILCIFVILLFIIMLDKHWEGYKDPWKNLTIVETIKNNIIRLQDIIIRIRK